VDEWRNADVRAGGLEGRASTLVPSSYGASDSLSDSGWTATRYFPAWALPDLWSIEGCESGHGTDPATYDLTAAHGGPLQISKATWEPFFAGRWTWEQIVTDPDIHYQAAYIIWERAGRTFSPWGCKP